MYQRIDFSQLGGYPLTQNTMAFLQNSYNDVLKAISRMAGNYIILSGVTTISPNVYSPGWCAVNGEIVPFAGGIGQTNVVVSESNQSEIFRDETSRVVLFNRTLGFTTGAGIPFTSFKRLSLEALNNIVTVIQGDVTTAINNSNTAISIANTAISNSNTAITNSTTAINYAVGSSLPIGAIILWYGSYATIPSGWTLCNGTSHNTTIGTIQAPDLRKRFVAGAGQNGDPNAYVVGQIGGQDTVQLFYNHMPSHRHHIGGTNTTSFAGGGSVPGVGPAPFEDAGYTDNAGDDDPHENRPPFRALCYIMKIA